MWHVALSEVGPFVARRIGALGSRLALANQALHPSWIGQLLKFQH